MRQAKRVDFHYFGKEAYNPETGQFETGETLVKTVPCFLMQVGLDRSVRVYGKADEDRLVVILRRPNSARLPDLIRVDGQDYRVTSKMLDGEVFHVVRSNVREVRP